MSSRAAPDHHAAYTNGWSSWREQDPMRTSHISATRDWQDGATSLTKVQTEPDVEHHEHVHISPGHTGDEETRASSHLHNTRAYLGLNPIAPIDDEHDMAEHSEIWWAKVRLSLREPFAEFWGVFIMVLFGNGSVAQVLLSAGERTAPGGNGFGSYQSISWGWGLGVMLGQSPPKIVIVYH